MMKKNPCRWLRGLRILFLCFCAVEGGALKAEVAVSRLTDPELRSALEAGAHIAVVRVEEATLEAPGTRAAVTHYRLRIEKNLAGQLAGTAEASRYGTAVLQKPQQAIVVLRNSQSWGLELQSFALLDAATADRSVKEHLTRIQEVSAPAGSAPHANRPALEAKETLSCSSRFYYAVSEEVSQEVLFFLRTLKNNGEKEVVLSFYGAEPYVTAIHPGAKLKSRLARIACGRPSTPVESDLVRIPPGGECCLLKWYWPDGNFPFHSGKKGEKVTVYDIPDNTKLRVSLCAQLSENQDELAPFLRPGEVLVRGTLCFEPAEFRYRKIQPR
jgi:hypothetical protein